MLKFFGRGAGFSDEHNSACFSMREKLVIMDCPLITFNKLKNTRNVWDLEISHDKVYSVFAIQNKISLVVY